MALSFTIPLAGSPIHPRNVALCLLLPQQQLLLSPTLSGRMLLLIRSSHPMVHCCRLHYQLPLAPPPPELDPPPKPELAPQAPVLAWSCCLSRESSAARTAVQFSGSPLRTCWPQRSITSPVTTWGNILYAQGESFQNLSAFGDSQLSPICEACKTERSQVKTGEGSFPADLSGLKLSFVAA